MIGHDSEGEEELCGNEVSWESQICHQCKNSLVGSFFAGGEVPRWALQNP